MQTYIVFLRGVNVGGHRKIKMADLKVALDNQGFENVITYIQSGNLVLQSTDNTNTLKTSIEARIAAVFGFELPVLVLTVKTLRSVLEHRPFKRAENKNLYFALLFERPSDTAVANFETIKFAHEDFQISERCVYLNCKQGAGKAKLNNTVIEKHLQVLATTRNKNTVLKMLELAMSTA